MIGKRTSIVQCYIVNNLISPLKSSYYTSIINEDSSDQRVLFKTVNKLMQRSQRRDICLLLAMLCLLIQLLTFSLPQVEKIHTALVARNRDLSLADDDELPTDAAELNIFMSSVKKMSRNLLISL